VPLDHGSRITPLARLSGMTGEWVASVASHGRMRHAARLPSFVMVVLGTTIHESAGVIWARPKELVDGPPTNVGLRQRTKSDHDGMGRL
jgi:hypothetical protein